MDGRDYFAVVGICLILIGVCGLLVSQYRLRHWRKEIRESAKCGSKFKYVEKTWPKEPTTVVPQHTWYYTSEPVIPDSTFKDIVDAINKEIFDILMKVHDKETRGNNVSDGQPNPVEVST